MRRSRFTSPPFRSWRHRRSDRPVRTGPNDPVLPRRQQPAGRGADRARRNDRWLLRRARWSAAAGPPPPARRLNALQPDALSTICSVLPLLVDAARTGQLRIHVARIAVFGDMLDPGIADQAADVFGVAPIEGYPTTDVGYIARAGFFDVATWSALSTGGSHRGVRPSAGSDSAVCPTCSERPSCSCATATRGS